jgi:midasin (ATPase involved in ribosome maturation)|eukprot:SAG25_NODE_72_length_17288_cov_26.538775_9_plen_74_part_00
MCVCARGGARRAGLWRYVHHAGAACESLLVLNKALERLQVGQVAVVRFGEEVELLKPFEKPYNADLGAQVTAI